MTVAFIRPELLYAWQGPSLLVVNAHGACDDRQPLTGFFHRETRFLRTLRLEVNGELPWLCEAACVAPETLAFTYVHPEIKEPSGGGTGRAGDEEHTDVHGVPERSLDLRLSYTVGVSQLSIELAVTNRARRPVEVELAWVVDADFADILEAQAGRREQTGPVRTTDRDGEVEFAYDHQRLPYRTRVRHGEPWSRSGDRITTRVALAPQKTSKLTLLVVPLDSVVGESDTSVAERVAVRDAWRNRFMRFDVPGNRAIEQVLTNNVRDIASLPLLDGPPDEWLALQAGIPLYPAFFGRDAVTAGWQAGCLDGGQSLDAALTRLGRLQSDRFDEWREEEPGRLPYQVRSGPLARLDLNPYSAYYADFATPLMFVIALANLHAWTGNKVLLDKHWDTARRILDWARDHGDPDRDGYLEYRTHSSKGTKNQGWKDSGDAIVYDDGAPVQPPIATCELQGYWYIAQELMGALAWIRGARDDASAHRESAAALKARFNRDWWVEDEQFFALALDPDKQQVRAVTSNVGHCLACGIIERERLPRLVERLFAPDLFSGWGIRTLSSRHAYYDPLSYHRGSVWAVEQGTIAFGLRRFGFDAQALTLTSALFDLAQLYPEHRIPECVGGYARDARRGPGSYPKANAPQLWNATAFPLIMQSILGLVPFAPAETLLLDPALPPWLPEVVLHDLRVGEALVTLRVWRNAEGASEWEVLHKRGTLHVVRQPPPESLSARWTDRAKGLLETLLQ
jgi:glycogen debranching enzyme